MFDPFVIEVWGKPAGIVLKEGDAFRFHAIDPSFLELDGVQFTTPGHARLAAARSFRSPARSRPRSEPRHGSFLGQGQPLGQQLSVVILEARRQHA